MKVNSVVETPEGAIVFNATLEGDELTLVLSVGLMTLLQAGAYPFATKERAKSLAPSSENLQ